MTYWSGQTATQSSVDKVLAAWQVGERLRLHRNNFWTDGESLFSYAACLLTSDNGRLIYNATKYTPTTTHHQYNCHAFLHDRPHAVVYGCGFRVSARELILKASPPTHDEIQYAKQRQFEALQTANVKEQS